MASKSSLHAKLITIREALNGAIEKTGDNKTLRFAYAEAVEVGRQFVEQATPLGITMVPTVCEVVDIRPSVTGKQHVVTVKTTWQITDAETGETINVESLGQGADNSDKAAPKAQTNAMKYAILMLLQTVADDPEQDEEKPARKKRTEPREEKQTDDQVVEDAASDKLKRKVRARQKEVELDDFQLKALAAAATGKKSSKDWTTRDAEKILRQLDRDSIVETFKDVSEPKDRE